MFNYDDEIIFWILIEFKIMHMKKIKKITYLISKYKSKTRNRIYKNGD